MIDLLVAGGGPVGLATALLAAGQGLSAVVVEPRPDPVDKACGEGLTPGAVAALARLGVSPVGRPFHGIRYLEGRYAAAGRFRAGPGLGVRRTVLHAALAERVAAVGVPRVQGRVSDVVQGDGWVAAAGLRARWLVAADGLHSPTRHALGVDRPPPLPRRYGLRRHFVVPAWTDLVEVHWAPRGEAYVTPVGEDLVGVALLVDGAGLAFDAALAGFPALAERLAGAPPAGPVRGAGPLAQGARRRVCGRVLLVGDAAGYLDALTGEGIRAGVASAAAAVRCLRAGRPQDYEAAWRRVNRRHRMLTLALLQARHRPRLRGRIVPAAAALPGLFGAAVNALA